MIDSVYEMIAQAKRLPLKSQQSMLRVLEDWEAQFQLWLNDPSSLDKDESTHAGIVLVLGRLLEK